MQYVPVLDSNQRPLMEKSCTKCRTTKPLTEFYSHALKPLGVQSSCKSCWAERRKTTEFKSKRSVYRKAYYRDDPRKPLLDLAKHRAKRDGLPFDITVEDISIPEFCPILGTKIAVSENLYGDNSPSVDKVVPSLGYVKGNVYIVSHRANRLKSDATIDELLAVIQYIKERSS